MKTKGKYKKFQVDWWSKIDGPCTYRNFRKWFLFRKTCRYMKHKEGVEI